MLQTHSKVAELAAMAVNKMCLELPICAIGRRFGYVCLLLLLIIIFTA